MKKRKPVFITAIVLVAILSFTFIFSPLSAASTRITVSGTEFSLGGNRIWMNGANTPWDNWNDFGGSYDADWWNNHFQELNENGINSSRIWITCSGEVGINIDDSGYVSSATTAHWEDLDSLFQIAEENQIYIMATLISFDHFKNTYTTYEKWRNMITDTSNIDSYVENYVTPFTNRYKDNPYLWSIDLCNEPDWIYENEECGQISWDWLKTYFAKSAVAIHENSDVLVTVGTAMIKYNSDTCAGSQGNQISDEALQAIVDSSDARLDFYSTHYYDWMEEYWGNPFYMSPTEYELEDSKPSMLGETPAVGTSGHTITEDYENCFQNGWQGAMAWTSNGVDSNGSLTELGEATSTFRDNHYSLVYPDGDIPTETSTTTSEPTDTTTSEPTDTATSEPTDTPVTDTDVSVNYNIQNDWGGGATVSVEIQNNSDSNIEGWSLGWDFSSDESILNLWNGSFSQSASTVTVENASYNSTISTNSSVSFGFNLSHSGSTSVPDTFSLNGEIIE
jgi:hypothetical protein